MRLKQSVPWFLTLLLLYLTLFSAIFLATTSQDSPRETGTDIKEEALKDKVQPPSPAPSPQTKQTNLIASCREITNSGEYTLTKDLVVKNKTCLNIHDVSNVIIDCKNHAIKTDPSISYIDQPHIFISNVKKFEVQNCILGSPSQGNIRKTSSSTASLKIRNSTGGFIAQNTLKSIVDVEKSNNLKIINNDFEYAPYRQKGSSNNIFQSNNIKDDCCFVVSSYYGSGNHFIKNIIDGSWHGALPYTGNQPGADNGIFLEEESNDIISDNTISNVYNTGIETLGLIKNSTFSNNQIENAGLCGIGAWYSNQWINNIVSNNQVSGSLGLINFGYINPPDPLETIYFKDNHFSGNKLIAPRGSAPEGIVIQLVNLPLPTGSPKVQLTNNSFVNNDIGSLDVYINPLNLAVDQGGNTCGSKRKDYNPLSCNK